MENILLIGIEGVYNYGCEAIVRGTYNILKSVYPHVNISYASYNYQYDKARLRDLDMNILGRKHLKRWSVRNIARKLLSKIGLNVTNPYDKIKDFARYDYVFSIGGDIYTLNADGSYNNSLPSFLGRLQEQGTKYILWGCSVGPFEKNPQALDYFKKHLKKIDLIVARETSTLDYLKNIGVEKNVVLGPDPAFFVKGPEKGYDKDRARKTTFGINLSPLSSLYEYGSLENAKKEQSQTIKWLIETFDADIILLPHVLSPNALDNDYNYLRDIYTLIPNEFKCRIKIVENDPGFVGIKEYITQCDLVIAARMHCAINSIASGVPALFLSYSSKAIGMSEYVYGSNEYVLPLSKLSDTTVLEERVKSLLNKKIDLRKFNNFNYSKLINKR